MREYVYILWISGFQWKQELDTNITLPNGSSLPVILLGNKVHKRVGWVLIGKAFLDISFKTRNEATMTW